MSSKQILYLCHRIPFPPNKGDKIRSYHQVKYLASRAEVDLITFADDPGDIQYGRQLREVCRKVCVVPLTKPLALCRGALSLAVGQTITQGYFFHPRFRQTLKNWTASTCYDAVFCFSSSMAGYVMGHDWKAFPEIITLMDFCDVDSEKWRQYACQKPFPLNRVFGVEATRLSRFEKRINDRFLHSVFISSDEAALFKRRYPGARSVHVLGNGVDSRYFEREKGGRFTPESRPMLMFSGAMDYYANVEGVTWFVNKIFPLVKMAFPEAMFYIVGSNPSPVVKALEKHPGVTVTGFVPDMRPYYNGADLCVLPLTIARGVQNKLLEALAMEKPVVATTCACQGTRVRPGMDLYQADDPDDFASACIDLLRDRSAARACAQSARQFILAHHDWDRILNRSFQHLLPGLE